MRRSKALPSKTVRSYRKVSQRRMTEQDAVAEDEAAFQAETKRLQAIIDQNTIPEGEEEEKQDQKKKDNDEKWNKQNDNTTNPYYEQDDDDHDLILLPSKKKKKLKSMSLSSRIPLTPAEIQAARKERQAAARKLRQLQERRARKLSRQVVETKLAASAAAVVHKPPSALLQSSARLGQSLTKRQRLAQSLAAERAGIPLTQAQQQELYATTRPNINSDDDDHDDDNMDDEDVPTKKDSTVADTTTSTTKSTTTTTTTSIKQPQSPPQSTSTTTATAAAPTNNHSNTTNNNASSWAAQMMASLQTLSHTKNTTLQQSPTMHEDSLNKLATTNISTTKVSTTTTTTDKDEEYKQHHDSQKASKEKKKKGPYVPPPPTVLSLQVGNHHSVKSTTTTTTHRVLPAPIVRPAELQELRQALPIATMEFEIMEAIQSSYVTIVCSETGSGKSTQIPQYLYEHGLTSSSSQTNGAASGNLKIAVTQPRRVAAITTAQRVAYEMQCYNNTTTTTANQKKKKKRKRNNNNNNNHNTMPLDNLVAYQTRYETAGWGPSTRIKFMTDGILLQEMQSDLLLRQYSVVVLDEAHERNLNTDVLLGLLSLALPLRAQAALDDVSLPPLKVVIMSATLRIADFTEGPLFRYSSLPPQLSPESFRPHVIQVPGRTHPVTIHHAKITSTAENYQDAALRKVLQIHSKLPAGGILVFLTGRQEITRMVQRLRRKLCAHKKDSVPSSKSTSNSTTEQSQHITIAPNSTDANDNTLRELDDEEMDGDLLLQDSDDEIDDDNEDDDEDMTNMNDVQPTKDDDHDDKNAKDASDKIPRKAIILPLYSLLSAEEQAKAFRPVPEGHRLIVVATNIAETSITIPGISYVVDTGRQKCRNYDAGTGVASYNVMWISQAAADQRAGRAGRTGPGHCYRLYSSSLYSRHMDAFDLPEVLTRPLEDVVLAMKAMRISNVSTFPFPTPPERKQVDAAVRLLADLACLNLDERADGDGEITRLGKAVAQLPLGVRYGKMVLVASEAGVLDYVIAAVSALSENSPFITSTTDIDKDDEDDEESGNDVDNESKDKTEPQEKKQKGYWARRGGDVLATVMAVGAYTHAGKNAGGAAQRLACKRFCEQHGLNPVIMSRIHDMRVKLTRLLGRRLVNKIESDKFHSLKPPNKLQERLVVQSIASGLLDNVATLAPVASFSSDHPLNLRSAYLGATTDAQEPLFMDRNSVLYSGDTRVLPHWVCYNTLVRKIHQKSGQQIVTMKFVTALDPSWLGTLAKGSRLLNLGSPLATPMPQYSHEQDCMMCSVTTKFGRHSWQITPLRIPWDQVFGKSSSASGSITTTRTISSDDKYAWFGRFLLEGKVFPELDALRGMLRSETTILTNSKIPPKSVRSLLTNLQTVDIVSRRDLSKAWRDRGPRFLWSSVQPLVRPERVSEAESLWVATARIYMVSTC